ncbi:MAG: hypothetical protein GY702_16860 [Desulfobulbaceae bacterium]|nr:hypothetical protein [Desulfobulbaceae bacterium]
MFSSANWKEIFSIFQKQPKTIVIVFAAGLALSYWYMNDRLNTVESTSEATIKTFEARAQLHMTEKTAMVTALKKSQVEIDDLQNGRLDFISFKGRVGGYWGYGGSSDVNLFDVQILDFKKMH